MLWRITQGYGLYCNARIHFWYIFEVHVVYYYLDKGVKAMKQNTKMYSKCLNNLCHTFQVWIILPTDLQTKPLGLGNHHSVLYEGILLVYSYLFRFLVDLDSSSCNKLVLNWTPRWIEGLAGLTTISSFEGCVIESDPSSCLKYLEGRLRILLEGRTDRAENH